jgi:nucleotide-binding universal stress UspA family protein
MTTVKKILVPTDGSPSSMRALELAGKKQLAGGRIAILVLNVQPPLPSSRHVTKPMIAEFHARQSEAALKPAQALMKRMQLEADCYVRVGEPARTIAAFARSAGCHEIILGTRGLGRVAGLVLGSVAMKVIHLARVPVTLVK